MKFYVFNRSHTSNIGDQLIGEVIRLTLHSTGHVTIINKGFQLNESSIHSAKQHILSYLSDIKNLKNVDALIIGGGNLIMDTTGVGWALHQFWLSMLCWFYKKDYFYLCVGVNPLNYKSSRLLFQFSLNRAKRISVRDSGSKFYLEELTARNDIQVIPDPVLSISTFYPSRSQRSKVIGICPIQFEKVIGPKNLHEKYVELHINLAKYFISLGYKVSLFSNDPDIDHQTTVEIAQQLPPEGIQIEELVSKDRKKYLSFINSLSYLVTSRMHAAICAISYGIPCAGLGWQPKMKFLFQDLNLEGYVDIITLLSEKSLEESFEQVVQVFHTNQHSPVLPRNQELDIAKFLSA